MTTTTPTKSEPGTETITIGQAKQMIPDLSTITDEDTRKVFTGHFNAFWKLVQEEHADEFEYHDTVLSGTCVTYLNKWLEWHKEEVTEKE